MLIGGRARCDGARAITRGGACERAIRKRDKLLRAQARPNAAQRCVKIRIPIRVNVHLNANELIGWLGQIGWRRD
jgi:hypothetical protein